MSQHEPDTSSSCVCFVSQELEMLNEVSEASASMNEEVNRLQTQPRYWRRGEKHTLCK